MVIPSMRSRITLGAAAVVLLACLGAAFPANADGTGQSVDPRTRQTARYCPPVCSPSCPAQVTVNCQTAAEKPSGEATAKAASTKEGSAKDGSSWAQVVTHIIDILPQILWFVFALAFAVGLLKVLPNDLFHRLLPNLTKFKAGGFELEFNQQRAREVERDFKESYSSFKSAAQIEYDRQAGIQQLPEVFLPAVVRAVEARIGKLPSKFRATIHVPDVVFKRFLYQVLDYYPEGSGKGRRFSERYGIIGRSWRLRASDADNDALKLVDSQQPVSEEEKIQALIRQWGMTRQEAEQARRNRRSVVCVLLKVPKHGIHVPVGILYMDSEESNAFWKQGMSSSTAATGGASPANDYSKFAVELEKDDAVKALASAVAEMMTELRKGAAFLEIP